MNGCPHCGSDEVQLRPRVAVNLAEGRVTSASVLGGKFGAVCLSCGREFRVYVSDTDMETMTVRSIETDVSVDV